MDDRHLPLVDSVSEEAGRELDALIAERVFGEVCGHAPIGDGLTRTSQYWAPTLAEVDTMIRERYARHVAAGKELWAAQYCGPDYSTDIAAAWEVVEKLMEANDVEVYRLHSVPPEPTEWACRIGNAIDGPCEFASAGSAPLAICRAALAAVNGRAP